MATLAVHEAMGAKVDREAVAGLVLPQLWAMSMGPRKSGPRCESEANSVSAQRRPVWSLHDVRACHTPLLRLIVDRVIKSLGLRVEKEHTQHLRDVRRIEQQTAGYSPSLGLGSSSNGLGMAMNGGEVDFEALVKGQNANVVSPPMVSDDPWGNDDGWGSAGGDEVGLVST